ncbi:MAG: hypothetical protein J2P30_26275 [Actinobacteria bacterium]|nr:hypothetical protein [Actinomycetota bacterium]
MSGAPGWAWAAGVGLILGLLAVDLTAVLAFIGVKMLLAPVVRPHDLHIGCAGPAPRRDVLEASTRQVATEDERHQDAVLAAERLHARP